MINLATIDVERPTADDVKWMKELIQQFVDETGSILGAQILESWANEEQSFIKIFPKDYKRALAEIEAKKAIEEAKKADDDALAAEQERRLLKSNTLQVEVSANKF